MADLPKWRTTDSKFIIKDQWIALRADTCITPEGDTLDPYYVLEYPDWVSCLVISDEGEVTLLNHYRYGIDDYVLEVVGGIVDEGESPDETIRRELEEEIGLVGAKIHQVGVTYANPSFLTNKDYCYVAIGGKTHAKTRRGPGENFEITRMPLDELIQHIHKGDIIFQSMHIACVFLALDFLKNHKTELAPTINFDILR